MPTGTIKRLVRDRGFGFIRDDGGQEWFFHRSGVRATSIRSPKGSASRSTKRRPRRARARATFVRNPDSPDCE